MDEDAAVGGRAEQHEVREGAADIDAGDERG